MSEKTVVGIFDSERVAKEAIEDLRRSGFEKEISLLAKDQKGGRGQGGRGEGGGQGGGRDMEAGTLADGITTGGVLGGLGGLAIGAGALVVPGLGPLIAAGPIAGLLSGAATGGVAGGLVDWGIPEQEGRRYEEKIKQNKIMVAIRSSEDTIDEAENILKNHGAQEVKVHEGTR
ncbi:MAG: hypothetical protein AB1420_08300 [Bacillota bacterium]